ncbi:hypothetical protein JCM11641_002269 [Rhodosporidiobolus odoratus]
MPQSVQSSPRVRIGINGFGRIGRAAFRASLEREDLEVVAINHTAPSLRYFLHSCLYDSTHGRCKFAANLRIDEESQSLFFEDRKIKLFSERDPLKLQWNGAGAEYIIEATGKMLTVEAASQHIKSGARKVVISAPSKDAKTIVVGVNRKEYKPDMQVISNASCTTNCLAPLAKVLHQAFGIESALLTTIHASTSSQHILDGYNKKSVRLGRASGTNIIPTTTGANKAISLVLPELAGRFTGISVRVPVQNVSLVDLSVVLSRPVPSKEALLQPLRDAAAGKLKSSIGPLSNVIAVNDDELVSSDFNGWQQSCIVDSEATVMLNERTFKIIAAYDNECGYSVRLLDLIVYMYTMDRGMQSPPDRSLPPVDAVSLNAAVEAAL